MLSFLVSLNMHRRRFGLVNCLMLLVNYLLFLFFSGLLDRCLCFSLLGWSLGRFWFRSRFCCGLLFL